MIASVDPDPDPDSHCEPATHYPLPIPTQILAQIFTLYFFMACYWNTLERNSTDRWSVDDPNMANLLLVVALTAYWTARRGLPDVSLPSPIPSTFPCPLACHLTEERCSGAQELGLVQLGQRWIRVGCPDTAWTHFAHFRNAACPRPEPTTERGCSAPPPSF